MLSECIYTSGGGGSAVSGALSDTTSASELVEIETGLQTVTHFTLTGKTTYAAHKYNQIVMYDANIDSGKYASICLYGLNACYGDRDVALGTATSQYAFKLQSIVGGKITLYSPSSSAIYGACNNLHWFAD